MSRPSWLRNFRNLSMTRRHTTADKRMRTLYTKSKAGPVEVFNRQNNSEKLCVGPSRCTSWIDDIFEACMSRLLNVEKATLQGSTLPLSIQKTRNLDRDVRT
jgi:hypothetical protein